MLGALEDYEAALTKYTFIISKIESHSHQDELSPSIIHTMIRSFCDWVECAAEIPSFDNYNLMDVFDEGERYMSTTGLMNYRSNFLHTKSIALRRLGQLEMAALVAEEGLSLKRINSTSPGCGLYHHLEIYGGILGLLDRGEAIDILDEAVANYPALSDTWSVRAHFYLRKGDFIAAIDDYTEAIFLLGSASRYKERALAYALSNYKEAALGDLRKALKEDRKDISSALWLAGLGNLYSRLRQFADSHLWIANVARFYLGELGKNELLEIADKTGSGRTRNKYLCKSHTFIGLFHEGQGDVNLAKRHYQLSVATNAIREDEYIWAEARLNQIR